jgi:hypothetical protein
MQYIRKIVHRVLTMFCQVLTINACGQALSRAVLGLSDKNFCSLFSTHLVSIGLPPIVVTTLALVATIASSRGQWFTFHIQTGWAVLPLFLLLQQIIDFAAAVATLCVFVIVVVVIAVYSTTNAMGSIGMQNFQGCHIHHGM